MSYRELNEFFDPALLLPIGGKEYRVESPSAHEGLRLRMLLLTGRVLNHETELDELQALMGDTFDEMRADGIKWPEIIHASRTALLHFALSPAIAVKHWGGEVDDPGNPAPPDPATASGANLISLCPERTGPMIPAAASSTPSTA